MGHVAHRHAAPDAIEQFLLGDEFLRPLGQQCSTADARGVSFTSLPSRQSCPVRASKRNKPNANCRSAAMRQLASEFPGSFPELRRDFPAVAAQFVARRREGRNRHGDAK